MEDYIEKKIKGVWYYFIPPHDKGIALNTQTAYTRARQELEDSRQRCAKIEEDYNLLKEESYSLQRQLSRAKRILIGAVLVVICLLVLILF